MSHTLLRVMSSSPLLTSLIAMLGNMPPQGDRRLAMLGGNKSQRLCVAASVQLLYETFLRDFFAADEIDDELFLTEMRDGGFLGDGSEEF